MQFWLLAALATLSACRTLSESSLSESDGSDPTIDLKALANYTMTDDALLKLASRIGCDEAARRIAVLPSPTLSTAVNTVYQAPSMYDAFISQFMESKRAQSRCRQVAKAAAQSPTLGFELWADAALKKGRGLTFIMQGGFGSHVTEKGALHDSRTSWEAAATEISRKYGVTKGVRVWRIECSNSYAADDRCSAELLQSIAKNEREEPSTIPHVYLMWGYSKGGNTVLQALSQSADLRGKTVAVFTAASPLGGGIAMEMVQPLLEATLKAQSQFLGKFPEVARAAPAALAMTPQGLSDYLAILSPEQLPEAKEGAQSIHPNTRRQYLYSKFKDQNATRAPDPVFSRTSLPIFHIAALLDVAEMQPIPQLATSNGAVAVRTGSNNVDHLQELALISLFARYPLSDSCVALQHTVLPKDALPPGFQTDLLAILKTDHLAMRLFPQGQPDAMPGPHIVDALLHAAFDKMARAQ